MYSIKLSRANFLLIIISYYSTCNKNKYTKRAKYLNFEMVKYQNYKILWYTGKIIIKHCKRGTKLFTSLSCTLSCACPLCSAKWVTVMASNIPKQMKWKNWFLSGLNPCIYIMQWNAAGLSPRKRSELRKMLSDKDIYMFY